MVSANDVIEHFAFPGNIDFATDDQGALCLFIVFETKFTIGVSRTISHANDTQARKVAPNPRPGTRNSSGARTPVSATVVRWSIGTKQNHETVKQNRKTQNKITKLKTESQKPKQNRKIQNRSTKVKKESQNPKTESQKSKHNHKTQNENTKQIKEKKNSNTILVFSVERISPEVSMNITTA